MHTYLKSVLPCLGLKCLELGCLVQRYWVLAGLCVAGSSTSLFAELPIPRLTAVFPAGARQGTAVEVTLTGGEQFDLQRLYFNHPGIKSEQLPVEANQPPKIKVTVAADVPVGEYDVRCVARLGVSNPRTFVVSDMPESTEKEPNNEFAAANRVEMNSVVNGRIDGSEDVDWFVVSAKQGQRLLAEVRAARIDSRLDGFLWIYDGAGKLIAQSQDENTRDERNDPTIDFLIPADGEYYFKLTDFMYNGNAELVYRLKIGVQPTIDFVLPTGAQVGQPATVTLYGRNLPGGKKSDVIIEKHPLDMLALPVNPPADAAVRLLTTGVVRAPAARLSGVELRVKNEAGSSDDKLLVGGTLPERMEREPNNDPASAELLPGPVAVTGQFGAAKDIDCFKWKVEKDEPWSIEIFAQRIGSPADPDLEILNTKGDVVASSQDDGDNVGNIRFPSFSRDVRHYFVIGEPGEYVIRLEHLFGQVQGGPAYVYRMEINRKQQDFQIICQPPHETRMDAHVLYQGGRERMDMLVYRLGDFNGPIQVNVTGLPAGVTADPLTIGPNVRWGALVLNAAADAPFAEAELQVTATAECNGKQIQRFARGGVITWDTGNTSAVSRVARSIVLAVRGKSPFKITATPAAATLKQGEPLILTMAVQRHQELAGEVQFSAAGVPLPQGMELPIVKVPNGQDQAPMTIKTDNIPPGVYGFVVNGEAQTPFEPAPGNKQTLRCVYPSNIITLTVTPK